MKKLLFTLMLLVTTAVTMSAQDVQEQTPAPVIHIQSTPGEHSFIVNENHYNVYITDDIEVTIEPADEAEQSIYYRIYLYGDLQTEWCEYHVGDVLTVTDAGCYVVEAFAQADGMLPSDIVSSMFSNYVIYQGSYFRVDDIFYTSYDFRNLYVTRDFEMGDVVASYSGDVTIPETVEIEGSIYTVIGIEGYTFISPDVTSVVLPSTLRYIGSQAFQGSGISELNIPASVIDIGEFVAGNCSNLASISVDPDNTVYDSRDDCNAIIETRTNKLLTGCQNTVIPISVTSIGENSFYSCTGLTTMVIPNTVTNIGHEAFYGCSALSSVEIPGSVTKIDYRAFGYCTALTSVVIPNSVTTIGNFTFEGCRSLKSVVLPNSITCINSNVFCDCYALESIEIPVSVTQISNSAFYACRSLTDVVIPDSVTSVGYIAFGECTALKSVTIGKSVTSLSSSFKGCTALESIKVLATTPPNASYLLSSSLGSQLYDQVTLFVPNESLEAYRAHAEWGKFTHIVPFLGAGPGDINGDGTITVTDVVNIINMILNAGEDDLPMYCDVNGDGTVNIADITSLINMLLNAAQ